jgi:hypothetical protein
MVLVGSDYLSGNWRDEGVEPLGLGALWRKGAGRNIFHHNTFVATNLKIKSP